ASACVAGGGSSCASPPSSASSPGRPPCIAGCSTSGVGSAGAVERADRLRQRSPACPIARAARRGFLACARLPLALLPATYSSKTHCLKTHFCLDPVRGPELGSTQVGERVDGDVWWDHPCAPAPDRLRWWASGCSLARASTHPKKGGHHDASTLDPRSPP